jgi:hypothetical protein
MSETPRICRGIINLWGMMPFKLRPTGVGSGTKNRPDDTVYGGQWDVGRTYLTVNRPAGMQTRVLITEPLPLELTRRGTDVFVGQIELASVSECDPGIMHSGII